MVDGPSNDMPDLVLSLVVLIVFIIFFGYMFYLLISSGFQRTSSNNPVSSDNQKSVYIQCPTGSCAVNLVSGFKTCPSESESITIDPMLSVCSSRFVCDSNILPFAVQSDGSTRIDGVCEANVACQCLKVSQCSEYILSIFTTSNGDPYSNFYHERITFPQQTSYVSSFDGSQTSTPPIQLINPSTSFCNVPISWLPFSTPGCGFISGANPNSITYNDILLCMGQINGCSGITGSPCLQGVLSFISDNPDTLTQKDIYTTQLACTRGTPCPCGFVSIFDTNYGTNVCRKLK